MPWIKSLNGIFWRCALAAIWVLASPQTQAQISVLNKAQATVQVEQQIKIQEVTLPYLWDAENPGKTGHASFVMSWSLDQIPTEPWALYLPRVGNTFEVWLNGNLLLRRGQLNTENSNDYAKTAHWVTLPVSGVQLNNRLEIRIHADSLRRAGLSPLEIGPQSELLPFYEKSYLLQTGWPLIVIAFSVSVSVLAFVLWRSRMSSPHALAKNEEIYLMAAWTELLWALRMLDTVFTEPPLPWPWWGGVTNMVYVLWIYSAFQFVHRVTEMDIKKIRPLLTLMMGLGFLSTTVGFVLGKPWLWTTWLGMASIGLLIYGLWFFYYSLRQPSFERILIAVAVAINVVAGFAEWLGRVGQTVYAPTPWLRYTAVLFGWALAIIVVYRFRQTSEINQGLTLSLTQRVTEKEVELAAIYLQKEQLARQHERTTERTRILRDMHDGVGANISTAIRQLEFGLATRKEVLITLRESMDQLKLSIDAMNLPLGDITSLLANLRYRLEPRLKVAGIELSWGVEQLPLMTWLDALAMRHVQFMVYEAISNALQHAGATVMRIELKPTQEGGAQLRVMDNGCGFDLSQVKQQGLSSLRERAKSLNALLQVISEPGQTVIQLTWSDDFALKSVPSLS